MVTGLELGQPKDNNFIFMLQLWSPKTERHPAHNHHQLLPQETRQRDAETDSKLDSRPKGMIYYPYFPLST